MFGYIKIHKDELLVREYEAYKAVYCGLCKRMGKEYSFFSRFILSYDCTFYAMFLMSQKGSCTGFQRKHCTCNPLKKCNFCTGGEEELSKASALSVILAYYKLQDDIHDSKLFKRTLIKIIKPIFSHWRKKASKKYPLMDKEAQNMLKNQFIAEQSSDCCLDMAAEPTAKLLSNLLKEEANEKNLKQIYSQIGYQLGRWIYLIDAADDLKDDIKDKCFNPFLLENESKITEDECKVILSRCLAQTFDAYNLLDFIDFKGILDNIILKGLPLTQEKVLSKPKGVKDERSI